ncbi:ADP-ribosylglycohydrolase, partial [Tothia fuscella]
SRIKGAIVGVCVCDALAGPYEWERPSNIPATITEYAPIQGLSGVFPTHQAGSYSNPGSHTLCLAQSLIDKHGKLNVQSIVQNLIHWKTTGWMSARPNEEPRFGYSTIEQALDVWPPFLLEATNLTFAGPGGDQITDAQKRKQIKRIVANGLKKVYNNRRLQNSEDSGSLIRCVPIALVSVAKGITDNDPDGLDWEDQALRSARAQSDITHPKIVCGDACVVYTSVLRTILGGHAERTTKGAIAAWVCNRDIADRKLRKLLRPKRDFASWQALGPERIRYNPNDRWEGAQDHVAQVLHGALRAFFTTDTFEDGVVRAIKLGGYYCKAIASVYGGLAGAYYGLEAIPQRWRDGLRRTGMIHHIATKMADL